MCAAGEHGVAPLGHPGPSGDGEEGVEGRPVHPVLGVVEDQVTGTGHHPPAATGILGEELAQVHGRRCGRRVPTAVRHSSVDREVHTASRSRPCGSSILSRRRPSGPLRSATVDSHLPSAEKITE